MDSAFIQGFTSFRFNISSPSGNLAKYMFVSFFVDMLLKNVAFQIRVWYSKLSARTFKQFLLLKLFTFIPKWKSWIYFSKRSKKKKRTCKVQRINVIKQSERTPFLMIHSRQQNYSSNWDSCQKTHT